MNKLGEVPAADLARIAEAGAVHASSASTRSRPKVNHDVIAFLTNVAEHVGPSSRFIHKGLTSSDVLDTALAVQMVQAVGPADRRRQGGARGPRRPRPGSTSTRP